MSLKINWDALQSYGIETKVKDYVEKIIGDILKRIPHFSSTFEIGRLKFGANPPIIELISMKDIDTALQWKLKTHEFSIGYINKVNFKANFQATVKLAYKGDFSVNFNADISYDSIIPGCITFPISASLSNLSLSGELSIQYLGDSVVLFFESEPTIDFSLELSMGADRRINDQHLVKDLVLEIIRDWVSANTVKPNALKVLLNQASSGIK